MAEAEDFESNLFEGIQALACGSDFVMSLKADGNVYGIGQNKSGQLGQGDTMQREQFTLVEALMTENVTGIVAGNQHVCAIVKRSDPFDQMIQEYQEANKDKSNPLKTGMIAITCSDGQMIRCHESILRAYFGSTPLPESVPLTFTQALLLFDLIYPLLDHSLTLPSFLRRHL